MLAASVYSLKRLFMEQDHKTVLSCQARHNVHYHLVMIVGEVGFLKDGSHLKLVGSNFVMPGFQGDAQLISRRLHIFHKCRDTGRDCSKVVVSKLLALG